MDRMNDLLTAEERKLVDAMRVAEQVGGGIETTDTLRLIAIIDRLSILSFAFNEAEMKVIEKLCAEKELSQNALLRQALRLYQLVADDPSRLKMEPLKKAPPWMNKDSYLELD